MLDGDIRLDLHNPRQIVRKAFQHQTTAHIPKGELWLGTDLLKKVGLEDNLEGHLELIKRLRMDLLCLPISTDAIYNKTLGYRYFTINDLKEAPRLTDLFVMAVIDGPFQRLTEEQGLINLLSLWIRGRDNILEQYNQARRKIEDLLAQALETHVDAVIIAEDLAGEQGPLISPADIHEYFSPFYVKAVSEIHKKEIYTLFHSCGKINALVPELVSYGFDGLAAVQHRSNDLISFKKAHGSNLTIMAGIDADLLETEKISFSALDQYRQLLRSLAPGGGLILSSCTGLYSDDYYDRIQELYHIADDTLIKDHI
ncbi:MAG: hypothetical protein JW932_20705 [Deltaproteobacteria bacterium]|nr:hypothetical protein [Deltaproteobacteria bacterium]